MPFHLILGQATLILEFQWPVVFKFSRSGGGPFHCERLGGCILGGVRKQSCVPRSPTSC